MLGGLQLSGGNFSCRIDATLIALDLAARKIIPDGWPFLSKLYCEGKTDVTQSN
jgi:hypothetical protein